MEELITISEVTKRFDVSTRTLRYYEQIGLLDSLRREGYAYRVYDEASCRRLSQILLLRKLRVSLKQVKTLLQSESVSQAITIFEKNISALNVEIASLTTVRDILSRFVHELREKTGVNLHTGLLNNPELLSALLPMQEKSKKEELSMEDLNLANANLTKLSDRDVRIVYLPPMTVAALHIMGNMAELEGAKHILKLITENDLKSRYPQMRHIGFNHPNGTEPDMSDHGYERWISIPDNMEVAPPFTKKRYKGGLYAAHTIPMGAFEEWQYLYEWVIHSDKYDFLPGDSECMDGWLEEHLNVINTYMLPPDAPVHQIDLLIPIKVRE